MRNIVDQLANLQRACLELAAGFERAAKLTGDDELGDALRNASAALIEMRRTTDDLSHYLRVEKRLRSVRPTK